VRTLQEWRCRVMGNLDAVRGQGFDQRFIRMWEYYLAISEAGFATGLTQDFQLVLEKKRGLSA
jgi:cyclopropane-fatty-acyl-phospholipid synthase